MIVCSSLDPTQPNDTYFTILNSAIHKARQGNLFVGLLPTRGDKGEFIQAFRSADNGYAMVCLPVGKRSSQAQKTWQAKLRYGVSIQKMKG